MRRDEALATLLCASLLSCGRSPAPKPAADQPREKLTARVGAVLPRPLTAASLTELVYGNGEGAKAMARWRPKKLWKGPDDPVFDEATEFVCKPVKLLPFPQGDEARAFLVMSANTPQNDCHGCAAILGAAALTEVAGGWRIDAVDSEVQTIGSYGQVPDGGFPVQIGPQKPGILLTPGFTNQGQTTSGLVLFAEQRNGGFAEILSVPETDADNGGSCEGEEGDGTGEPCWEYSSTWQFVTEKGRELYDFELTRKGTRRASEGAGVEDFTEKVLYRFDGAKYTLVK